MTIGLDLDRVRAFAASDGPARLHWILSVWRDVEKELGQSRHVGVFWLEDYSDALLWRLFGRPKGIVDGPARIWSGIDTAGFLKAVDLPLGDVETKLLTHRQPPIGGGLMLDEGDERFFFLVSIPGYGSHPQTISIMPNAFIPIFEQAAMIARLLGCDRYVAVGLDCTLGSERQSFLNYHPGFNPVLDSLTLSMDREDRREYLHGVHAEETIRTSRTSGAG